MVQGHVRKQDGTLRMLYRSDFLYLQFYLTPAPRGGFHVFHPSGPVWDAQDVYDDAHGFVRLTDLKG